MLDVNENKIYNMKPHSEIAFDNISDMTLCKALIPEDTLFSAQSL